MASVVDQLNELLFRERGEAEAVKELIVEIRNTDPDIADSARDALETASWSCQGLYHRIVHLGESPTIEAANLAEQVAELNDLKAKVKLICKDQQHDLALITELLRNELDADTRSFLQDLRAAHEATKTWCDSTLAQWKVDK